MRIKMSTTEEIKLFLCEDSSMSHEHEYFVNARLIWRMFYECKTYLKNVLWMQDLFEEDSVNARLIWRMFYECKTHLKNVLWMQDSFEKCYLQDSCKKSD